MKFKEFIGDRKFYKDVLIFGVPVALQNLLTSSMSLVDSMMIGGKGEIALGAVGMAAQWFSLISLSIWGIHSAGSMFFAQYWGAKDKDGIKKAAWVMFISVFLVTIPAAIITILFPELIMKIYSNDPSIIATGAGYVRIAALSCVFVAVSTGLSGILRSTGNAKLPLYASIVGLVSNTLLNWLLIYGKLGLPEMGANGAAFATSISSFLNMAILIVAAFIKKDIVLFVMKGIPVIEKTFTKEFYKKAIPMILNEAMYAFAMLFVNMVFGRQGAAAVAALAAYRTIENMVYAFYWGFVNASSVMIGNDIGAGRIRSGIVNSRRFTVMNFITTVIVVLAVYALKSFIVTLFGVGTEVREIIYSMLVVMMVMVPLRTCNWMLIGVYRAGGESKIGFYFEITSIWFVVLPLVLLAGMVWKLAFVWVFAMSYTDEIAKIGVQLWYMLSNKWIKPVTEEGRAGYEEYKKALNK